MSWRSNKIWLPLLLICLVVLIFTPFTAQKSVFPRMYKSLPPVLATPPPLALYAPAPTNYLDIGLKIGSCLGALMTFLNLIEKVVKWVRPKKTRKGGDIDAS